MKEDQIAFSDVLRILVKVCHERGQAAQEQAKRLKDNDWARGYESGYSLGLRWAANQLENVIPVVAELEQLVKRVAELIEKEELLIEQQRQNPTESVAPSSSADKEELLH